jgi:hypothetical protein
MQEYADPVSSSLAGLCLPEEVNFEFVDAFFLGSSSWSVIEMNKNMKLTLYCRLKL